MNKSNMHNQQISSRQGEKKSVRASRFLLMAGLTILSLGSIALFSEILRAAGSGAVGFMLLLGYEAECLAAGFTIWLGGGLLLDYLERQSGKDPR